MFYTNFWCWVFCLPKYVEISRSKTSAKVFHDQIFNNDTSKEPVLLNKGLDLIDFYFSPGLT